MKPPVIDRLRSTRLFLLDLDGTVYLGDTPIPGAIEFISLLRRHGIDYLFVTNNSSRCASDYVTKLSHLGFPVFPHQVLTSGEVTGWYLSEKKPQARLYVVGTASLKAELAAYGLYCIEKPQGDIDFVVAGFDRELTYEKLLIAGALLADGIPFVATNPDLVCPVGSGRYIPDCGSICAMLENATGRTPLFIGKPHTKIIEFLRARRGITTRMLTMIGDRLYTDIAFGCNASIMSICVLSGESSRKAVEKSPFQPDMVVDSVAQLIQHFS